jgi:Lrp/AsnC family transcriptional regulator for asnA, asnC and gidA
MIDKVDREIIQLLEQDARCSNREVARQMGVSESMVRTRLRKLQDSNAICFTLVTDPRAEGLHARAFVRLSVAPDSIDAVIENLVARQESAFVAYTAGRYNVIAFLLAANDMELRQIVSDDILNLEGVRTIDVRKTIKGLKYDSRLVRVIPRT